VDIPKILEVINTYREAFESMGIRPERHPDWLKPGSSKEAALAHCYYMINQMENFVEEKRIEKVFRWLGFVQGILWMTEQYTIDELKNHNRPDKEKKRP